MSRESMAAKTFAEKWKGQGAEKQQSQLFWLELMEKVLGAPHPTDLVRYQENLRCTNSFSPWRHNVSEDFFIFERMDSPWTS